MHIDIVSDIACPWCAIGYARLQVAMNQLVDDHDFTIEWHAFELNPDPDAPQEPILPALSRKYGRSEAEMEQTQAQMMTIASELGLNFSKMQQRFTCNTFDAHRLVKWAKQFDRQTDLKMALFDAYFGHAHDVSDHNVLLECVDKTGLDVAAAKQVLQSDDYGEDVRHDETVYQQAGVTAVPAFIIDQKYIISGAQESELLKKGLLEIASETK